MKHFFTKTVSLAVLLNFAFSAHGQWANQNLSNLLPTSVNTSLIGAGNGTHSLGNLQRNWRNVYVGSTYFLEDRPVLRAPGTTNFFGGPDAGNSGLTGGWNTGYGQNALRSLTNGAYNTGLGFEALTLNTTGLHNTAVGVYALDANTTGSYNTGVGSNALGANTIGHYNTGLGYYSLSANTSGNYNTGLGYRALSANTSGNYNTGVGYLSLYLNTTGTANTAHGYLSLYANSTGYENTAIGYYALRTNTTGYNNSASGHYALYANTTGRFNTATGHRALYATTTGAYNTAEGVFALSSNTTASYNSAFGYNALFSSTTAFYNSAFGSLALNATTTGGYNTAVGRRALEANTTGTFNTAIGYDAGSIITTLTNTTAIGNGARPLQSNQIWLGNASITSIRAAAGFVIMSDGRFKKDLNENVPGLEFINLLKPVTYHYNIKDLNEKTGAASARQSVQGDDGGEAQLRKQIEDAAIATKEKKLYTGFVAQQVEEAAKSLNYDFSGILAPQGENDVYGISYSDFVIPLVKAVQQLSGAKDSLEQLVLTLEDRLAKIESTLKINPSSSLTLSDASVAQNSPNPFKGNTVISYNLPQQGLTNAQIVVYDASGKQIKMFNLAGQGRGTVNVNANALPAGTYQYSLLVNGKIIETKKMVLTK